MYRYLLGFLGAVAVVGSITALSAVQAEPISLQSQQNAGGQVVVKVTPLTVQAGAAQWRFEVQLTTHSVPLTHDLVAASSLAGQAGAPEPPSAWEGDPPGGHHRKGVLSFNPLSPRPEAITLTIRDIGSVAERRFTWRLAP